MMMSSHHQIQRKATRNVNGAGGVSVSKDGRARYYLTIDGATIYKRAPSRAEAERRLEKWKRNVARGEYDTPSAERLTVGEILDVYQADLAKRGARSKNNGSMIAYLGKQVGAMPALKVSTAFLERWNAEEVAARRVRREVLDTKRRALGMHVRDYGFPPPEAVTVQHYLACLRAAFRCAVKRNMIRAVPFQLSLPAPKNALRGFFEVEEWSKVRLELQQPPACVRDAAGRVLSGDRDPRAQEKGEVYADFCHVGFLTGARREEVEQLRWSQVDREAGEVRLWETKSGEPRILILEGELAEIFERRWKAREYVDQEGGPTSISPLVFHVRGREIGDFRKAWRAAYTRAGVVGKKPFHDFRRSAARNMVRAGTPQRVAQQITGHETAAMFDRYNIVSTDDMRQAMRRTAAYLEQQREERDGKVRRLKNQR